MIGTAARPAAALSCCRPNAQAAHMNAPACRRAESVPTTSGVCCCGRAQGASPKYVSNRAGEASSPHRTARASRSGFQESATHRATVSESSLTVTPSATRTIRTAWSRAARAKNRPSWLNSAAVTAPVPASTVRTHASVSASITATHESTPPTASARWLRESASTRAAPASTRVSLTSFRPQPAVPSRTGTACFPEKAGSLASSARANRQRDPPPPPVVALAMTSSPDGVQSWAFISLGICVQLTTRRLTAS